MENKETIVEAERPAEEASPNFRQVAGPRVKYIMWMNKSATCWLDSSMALIVHNRTMKTLVHFSPECKINEIISMYRKAVRIVNGSDEKEKKIQEAVDKLSQVQDNTLKYLQPLLKFDEGAPDSAFCCLLNLISENKTFRQFFDVSWLWIRKCQYCNATLSSEWKKPIITLSKINQFIPQNPTCLYQCNCVETEQEMKLIYLSIPSCLIFHFENGAGDGNRFPLSFTIKEREYHLTGVVTLHKNTEGTNSHFITWIRNPYINQWLECNDMNPNIIYFSPNLPRFSLKNFYICVFESDDMGSIRNDVSTSLPEGDLSASNTEIPYVDISEEPQDKGNSVTGSSNIEDPDECNLVPELCHIVSEEKASDGRPESSETTNKTSIAVDCDSTSDSVQYLQDVFRDTSAESSSEIAILFDSREYDRYQ